MSDPHAPTPGTGERDGTPGPPHTPDTGSGLERYLRFNRALKFIDDGVWDAVGRMMDERK